MPLATLEQCFCGMIFTAPLKRDEDFRQHIRDRRHDDAMNITICGPCFAFMCWGCDGKRRNGPWSCDCKHRDNRLRSRDKRKSGPRNERAASMRLDWSTWLANRRPSEYQIKPSKGK